jgi:3-hydroxybutyryl-CoA dehydrogenase
VARPERVVGLHFFNPAPIMRLVEVVAGPRTEPAVADRAAALVESWGRTAVRSADAPGFIVNRVNRPYTIEALRMLEAAEATVAAIDGAMKLEGFPMGPFELIDLAGVDVNLAAATAVWEGLGRPDRLRPSPIQERLVEEGHLGRKTGQGFYRYSDGEQAIAREFSTGRPELAAGEIRERITLAVIDEAWRALGDGVATRDDIDLALRLGAAHPIGPFERTASLGGSAAVAQRLRELGREPAPALEAG